MKNLSILFIIASLLLASCGTNNTEGLPEDLTELRELQKKSKKEFRELEKKLGEIDSKIKSLDPNAREKTILVTTSNLEIKDFKNFVTIQSTVQSDEVVRVGSETGGRIVDVLSGRRR